VTVNLSLTGPQNTGGAGFDTLSSIENIDGSNNWSDTLIGDAGANVIRGYGWHDSIHGGAGDDRLHGGLGNDTLNGGAGNDFLDGGGGLDTATYVRAPSEVTVSLAVTGPQNTVGAGLDTLYLVENLTGSGFADRLTGSFVANVINGGGGNDRIQGGNGADVLTGGAGADTFVFALITDSDGLDRDRITDLGAGDVINLAGIDANGAGAGNTAFVRIGNVDPFTAPGQLRLSQHGPDTWLELNTDTDADAETTILLTGLHTAATAEDGWIL
jgi:Ca2+-binding RTX toxin-like protein